VAHTGRLPSQLRVTVTFGFDVKAVWRGADDAAAATTRVLPAAHDALLRDVATRLRQVVVTL